MWHKWNWITGAFSLALLLCLSLFPAAAFAETDAPEKEPFASPDSASRDDPEAGTDALPSTDEPQDLVASGDCGDGVGVRGE